MIIRNYTYFSSLHCSQNCSRKRQSGVTLIELLIAMVIGLFLLTGIASSYLSSKSASVKRSETSLLEDNGRLALEYISKSLEHAGYTLSSGSPQTPFIRDLANVTSETCSDGITQNVESTGIIRLTADGVAAGDSDSISAFFLGNNDIFTDCSGGILPVTCRLAPIPGVNVNPKASTIYNSFFVDNVNSALMCAGSRDSTAQVIAEGVENIQFLYGVDVIGNDNQVDRYVKATDVVSWNSIVSIQVAVLVRSLRMVKDKAETKTYTLLDEVVVSPTDRFQRSVFSTTIHLRN